MLKTGQIIKDLRKAADVTQEKLAAYLNISYQAISKWENGTALPDITLIPKIANFFGVTSDELLGMKENEQTEELKQYEKAYFDCRRQGKILKSIEVARNVLKKHPRNFQWLLNLTYSLIQYNVTEEQRAYSKEQKFEEQAIDICERILEDCTTDSIRHSAIQILCYTYPKMGETEKAVQLANQMPDLFVCKENLLNHIYKGEEQIKSCQHLLMLTVNQLCGIMWMLNSQDLMGKELTTSERIKLCEKAVLLLDLIFDSDKEKGFMITHKERIYERMAKIYAKDNDGDNTVKALLLAEKYADIADLALTQGETKYSSLILNRLNYNPKNILTNYEGTNKQFLLKTVLGDDNICRFKDNPQIADLIKRLNNHSA